MTMDRLRNAGYQIISVPDNALLPWTIIDGNLNEFKSWGPIWKFTEKYVKPEINKDITGPSVIVQECDALLDAKLGLSILNRLGLGIRGANLSAAYRNIKKFRIVYSSILKDGVDIIDICKYTRDNTPDISLLNGGQLASIDEKGEAALVIETLKSNNIDFVAFDEKGIEVELNIDAEVATPTGKFNKSTKNANTLCYTGTTPLVFAFHALPFWIQEIKGNYQFAFTVREKDTIGPGGFPMILTATGGQGSHENKDFMATAGKTHPLPHLKPKVITPDYIRSLDKKGLLEKQCASVFQPDFKVYSPKGMIKRVK